MDFYDKKNPRHLRLVSKDEAFKAAMQDTLRRMLNI